MTPTQLLNYATVVRVGSVRGAADELGISEAAVSGNVGALRRELDDRLFRPSRDGLVFTPGGLRLAHRAVEILGLQDLTRREIDDAHQGRRLLRIAATSLFAEYAAAGLIELFTMRADDLDVELTVSSSDGFDDLLLGHRVDVVIGPKSSVPKVGLVPTEFLRYEVTAVATPAVATAPEHHLWLLGPSALEPSGVSRFLLERANVPDDRQRIYPSHSAALEEAREGNGIAIVPLFAVTEALDSGGLTPIDGPNHRASGTWTAWTLPNDRATAVARELARFIVTPRAMQAMLSGSGSGIDTFKPQVHITLWS